MNNETPKLPDSYAPVPAMLMTWGRETTVHLGLDRRQHVSLALASNDRMLKSSIELFYDYVCDGDIDECGKNYQPHPWDLEYPALFP